MGFYGNVFYEITNAFASFLIKSTINSEPVKIEAIGTDGSFTFASGNQWIELNPNVNNYSCDFKHALIDPSRSGTNIIPFKQSTSNVQKIKLEPGDTIEIPEIKYDEAGHIVDASVKKYYTLPINETEINISDLQDRMSELEKTENGQNTKINNLEKSNEDLQGLVPRVESLEELPDQIQDIKNITDTIGNINNITSNDEATFASIIGNFEQILGESSLGNNLSECVATINTDINATNSTVRNNSLAITVAIKNLCKQLNDKNIEIDYDSLWEVQ